MNVVFLIFDETSVRDDILSKKCRICKVILRELV